MNKKTFSYFCIIFCIVITLFIILLPFSTSATRFEFRVVIDAGHGYPDGGAIGYFGTKESDINLEIAKILAKKCYNTSLMPILTRTGTNALYSGKNFKKNDMLKRKEIILKASPNLVISIHLNKFSDMSRRGAQVFYNQKSEESKKLANCIQNELNQINLRNFSALAGDYYLINCTDFPSVIIECGFISNAEEEKLLTDSVYQSALCDKILEGIIAYLA